jgi:hypothetical protein
MNKLTSGSGDGVSLSIGTLLWNMDMVPLMGTLEGKLNFQGMGCRRFCRWVSLSVGVLMENLRRGSN